MAKMLYDALVAVDLLGLSYKEAADMTGGQQAWDNSLLGGFVGNGMGVALG